MPEDFTMTIVITALITAVVAAAITWLFLKLRHSKELTAQRDSLLAEHKTEADRLNLEFQSELQQLLREQGDFKSEAAAATAQVTALSDQLRQLKQQVLEQQESEKARANQDSKVLQALSPVQETLRTMQNKVTELEQQRSQQYGSISEQLKQSQAAEEQIRKTAENLVSALTNNSARGAWGEAQLRNIVESAGLTNQVDFFQQSTITSDAGKGRPDMIIRLPGGKSIAVDAKVPFDAYYQASGIPVTASDEELARKATLLKNHVRQLKVHIDALAQKSYWDGLESSPEFVIAFIPSESLLSAALESEPTLLEYAFKKRVALASPVTFWSVLKTVSYSWQQEVLTEDAKRVFDLSKELYNRLSTLADHSERLRRSIESTVENYNKFASSLESRVLVTARQLNTIDESKVIGEAKQIENAPKALTSPELAVTDAISEAVEPTVAAKTDVADEAAETDEANEPDET